MTVWMRWSLAQQADHSAACGTILSQCQPERDASRHLAMSEAVRHKSVPVDASARDPVPPPPAAHNCDDLPGELVGNPEVYEGNDATSPVEAPLVALVVPSDPSMPTVLVLDGRGGRCHFCT